VLVALAPIDLADPANPTLTQTPDVDERRASGSPDDTRIVFDAGGDSFVLPTDGTGSASMILNNGFGADWRR
jgi:hypothetical protein